MKPLFAAITEGHVELVRNLVENGVDRDDVAWIGHGFLTEEEVEQQQTPQRRNSRHADAKEERCREKGGRKERTLKE
jgi:hypothetical protein